MKYNITEIGTSLALLTTACTICVLALRTIFDDRYLKKPEDPDNRIIIKREFEDYKELIKAFLVSIESELKNLKERIDRNGSNH